MAKSHGIKDYVEDLLKEFPELETEVTIPSQTGKFISLKPLIENESVSLALLNNWPLDKIPLEEKAQVNQDGFYKKDDYSVSEVHN